MLDLEWKEILHDALASTASQIIGGTILLALSLLIVILTDVGSWLLEGAVTIPGWLAVVLLALVGVLAWGAWPRLRELFGTGAQQSGSADELDEVQWTIIGMYAEERTRSLSLNNLDAGLLESRFRVEFAADQMCEYGYLEKRHVAGLGAVFKLTDDGRDLIVLAEEAVKQQEGSDRDQDDELTEFEQSVLRVFADRDGATVRRDTLESETNSNRLRVENAVEKLMGQGLLTHSSQYTMGTPVYQLTPTGRDYVIERGWA